MRERPILFSGPMVRAILAGTKTQTRRVVKPQPAGEWASPGRSSCPYGRPGDRLWVRETFGHFERSEGFKPGCAVFYRADGNCLKLEPWRPSIHMPRWACRLVLEISAIRMERLQAISEADAIAEGASFHDGLGVGHSGWRHDFGDVHATARDAFARLWRDLNGPDSWSANPWVWVVEFMRADTDKKEM